MKPATVALNEALIRFAKGMIGAWEMWVRAVRSN